MQTKNYFILSFIIFFISIFFYAYYHEYIILNIKKTTTTQLKQESSAKQKVTIFLWKNGWKSEELHLLLNQNISHDAQLILGNWLELALEEQIITKKITAQSLVNTDEQHLYLSFDHIPFSKENSTHEKWMIFESILKTFRTAFTSLKKVTFLLNHQPLIDPQIDFSNPWPIEGFIY